MDFVDLPGKSVPVYAEAEVVVVGGGPGGLSAAVASVRQGRKTILIDEGGILGGTVTKCIMPSFGSLNFKLIKGLFYEVCEKLKEKGALIQNEGRSSPFDPEAFKTVIFNLIEKFHAANKANTPTVIDSAVASSEPATSSMSNFFETPIVTPYPVS